MNFPVDLAIGYYFEIGFCWFFTMILLMVRVYDFVIMYQGYKKDRLKHATSVYYVCQVDLTITFCFQAALCVDLEGFFGIYNNLYVQWTLFQAISLTHTIAATFACYFIFASQYCFVFNKTFPLWISRTYCIVTILLNSFILCSLTLTALFDNQSFLRYAYLTWAFIFAVYGLCYAYFIFSSRNLLNSSIANLVHHSSNKDSIVCSTLPNIQSNGVRSSSLDSYSIETIVPPSLTIVKNDSDFFNDRGYHSATATETISVTFDSADDIKSSNTSSSDPLELIQSPLPANSCTRLNSVGNVYSPDKPIDKKVRLQRRASSLLLSIAQIKRNTDISNNLLRLGIITILTMFCGFIYFVYFAFTYNDVGSHYDSMIINPKFFDFTYNISLWFQFVLSFLMFRASRLHV